MMVGRSLKGESNRLRLSVILLWLIALLGDQDVRLKLMVYWQVVPVKKREGMAI